eukprot:1186000-Rhodomonas_salina.3
MVRASHCALTCAGHVQLWQSLRLLLAPALETLILLDRVSSQCSTHATVVWHTESCPYQATDTWVWRYQVLFVSGYAS